MDIDDLISRLTWGDLEHAFGATILKRGQDYFEQGFVRELYRMGEHEIIATVRGTRDYITAVAISDEDEDVFSSECSCPYEDDCKHVVAALLQYAAQISKGVEVPFIEEAKLENWLSKLENATDEWLDETPESNFTISPKLRSAIDAMSKQELSSALIDLANRFEAVETWLQHAVRLQRKNRGQLIRSIRGFLRDFETSDFDGYYTDHSESATLLLDHLKALLSIGAYEDLLTLGEELHPGVSIAIQQEEESDSFSIFEACARTTIEALNLVEWSARQKIDWAIQQVMEDEFGIYNDLTPEVIHALGNRSDWSETADHLIERLKERKGVNEDSDAWSEVCCRNSLFEWGVRSLEWAGRSREVLGYFRREAEVTGDAIPLIRRLIEERRWREAEDHCLRAIAKAELASSDFDLRMRTQRYHNLLVEIYEAEGRIDEAAAMLAFDFFDTPSVKSYFDLLTASRRSNEAIEASVRWFALHYLQTGQLPHSVVTAESEPYEWPLPTLDFLPAPSGRKRGKPDYQTLIDIGIEEQHPSEVLRWYKAFAEEKPRYYAEDSLARVANCLANEYSAWSVAIWKRIAESHIERVQPSAYEQAAPYLKRIKRALQKEQNHEEWERYYQTLVLKNRRRPRCMDVLRRIHDSDKPIL